MSATPRDVPRAVPPAVPPAVLVFLRLPEVGRVKTRLAAEIGAEAATRIYDRLARGVVRRLVGDPRWQLEIHVAGDEDADHPPPGSDGSVLSRAARWLAPAVDDGRAASPQPPRSANPPPAPRFFPQAKGDLGMRMESAFRGAFARGAPAACLVASDVPGLGPAQVADALVALGSSPSGEAATHPVVLGPSPDGGYYLAGLAAGALEPASALFRGIPWSTSEVLTLSLDRASRAGLAVRLLEPLGDVDHAEDLHRMQGLPPTGSPPYPPVSPHPRG